MKIYNLPDIFLKKAGLPRGVPLHHYFNSSSNHKTTVSLRTNLFSFLLEGKKVLHLPDQLTEIHSTEFTLLRKGNCFMTGQFSSGNRYESLLFFFSDNLLDDSFCTTP